MIGSPFITIPKIVVHPSVMRGFRTRAWRTYPREYLEYMWGWREGNAVCIVTTVSVDQESTSEWVRPIDEESEQSIHEEAREHELKVVGSIHTHPVLSRDPKWLREVNKLMSRADHCNGAGSENELVSAVVSMWVDEGRRYSSTHFWLPQGEIKPIRVSRA